jgi:hypothetical protein
MKLITSSNNTTKILLLCITLSFIISIFSNSLKENNKMLRNKLETASPKGPTKQKFVKSEYSVKVTKTWSIQIARAYRDLAGLGYISDVEASSQLEEISKGAKKNRSKISSLFKNLFENDRWEHVITKTGDKTYHNHSFTIIRNLSLKKIVITFSGSKREQLKDEYNQSGGVPFSSDLSYIKLLEYFKKLYFASKNDIRENFLKVYDPKRIDQVIFVGHSLGGAIASIAAYDFIKESIVKTNSVSPALITYGQPRTGNYAFANEIMKNVPIVFRHVNNFDLVIGVPACESKGNKCTNEFEKDGLDKKFFDYQKGFENYLKKNGLKESTKFFPYHFNGLILNKSESNFINCVKKSEVGPTDECRGTPSLEVVFHIYYYGYIVSDIWKPDEFPYDTDKENYVLANEVDESQIIKGKLVWEDYEKNFSYFNIGSMVKGVGNRALSAFGFVHGKKKF